MSRPNPVSRAKDAADMDKGAVRQKQYICRFAIGETIMAGSVNKVILVGNLGRDPEVRRTGAGDPIAALVLCGAHHADRVMIGGQWRVVDGAPLGVDVARLRHEHGEAAKRFLQAV